MNLRPKDKLRFCLFSVDGSDFRIVSETILGSGHPAFEKTGRYLFTDACSNEPVAMPDQQVPMRLIETRRNEEKDHRSIFTLEEQKVGVLRRSAGRPTADLHSESLEPA